MSPKELLRKVPTLDEWVQSKVDSSTRTLEDISDLELGYYNAFRVETPAADEDGWPTPIPDEHVLDALARDWTDEDELPQTMDFGTVVIAGELPRCDLCGWGAARYESQVRRQSAAWASLCHCCLVRQGDPVLGHGRATLLLLEEEVPDRVVSQVHRVMPEVALLRSTDTFQDGWDAFRRWGFFTGPDASWRLYGFMLGLQVSLELGPMDSLKLVARGAGNEHFYAPGGDVSYIPRVEDTLDARAVLIRAIRGEVTTGRARDEQDRHFHVDPTERDARALSHLRAGGTNRPLRLGDHRFCNSGDYQMLVAAAELSGDPSTVVEIAVGAQEGPIRMAAAENPCLPPSALAELASKRDPWLVGPLLGRSELPESATRQVIETLLLAGELSHAYVYTALQRADFPEDMLATVLQRISSTGTAARVDLATAVWDKVPAHRRDQIHLELLRRARKVKSTRELIGAVVGDDPARGEWLKSIEDWKIRRLLAWKDELEGSAEKPTGATPESLEPDRVHALPGTDRSTPAVDLTAPAVAARLRRWWLTEATVDAGLLESDLGDVLLECRLVRSGSELRVLMPYDFGSGSPVSSSIEQQLATQVSELTAAAVRELSWSFLRDVKTTTRKRSSDLDVYEPGDPVIEEWGPLADRLARAIERDAALSALPALRTLRLIAASRHRLWLGLPSAESVLDFRRTPGAAATLKIAVARVQGQKPEDGLYSLVADPDQSALSLPVVAS